MGALLLALCAACGGEATDTAPQSSPGTGGASGGASSTSGGTSSGGGAPSGGTSSGVSSGGASSGGSGGTNDDILSYWCWDWDELNNQPTPGKAGMQACPEFEQLDFVVKPDPYCVAQALPEATEPMGPDVETGDCCYAITWVYCR